MTRYQRRGGARILALNTFKKLGDSMSYRDRVLVMMRWLAIVGMVSWAVGPLRQSVEFISVWSSSPPNSVRTFFHDTDSGRHNVRFFGGPTMLARNLPLTHPAIARKGRSPSNPTPPQLLKSWTPSAVANSKLPATCSLWSTTNYDGSPHDDWLGRVRGKRSRPQRLFTKHICASSGPIRVSLGTAAATSSPPPPRRCGGFL